MQQMILSQVPIEILRAEISDDIFNRISPLLQFSNKPKEETKPETELEPELEQELSGPMCSTVLLNGHDP